MFWDFFGVLGRTNTMICTSERVRQFNKMQKTLLRIILVADIWLCLQHRGADKSLARPGRKQATATEDSKFHISYL